MSRVGIERRAGWGRFKCGCRFRSVCYQTRQKHGARVEVRGVSAEGMVERVVETGFIRGRSLRLPMFLAASCQGVACARPQQACRDSECRVVGVRATSILSDAPLQDAPRCECNADFDEGGTITGGDGNFITACIMDPSTCSDPDAADLNCDGVIDPCDFDVFTCQFMLGGPETSCCEQVECGACDVAGRCFASGQMSCADAFGSFRSGGNCDACACDANLDDDEFIGGLDFGAFIECLVGAPGCPDPTLADVNCDGRVDDCDGDVIACQFNTLGEPSCCTSTVCGACFNPRFRVEPCFVSGEATCDTARGAFVASRGCPPPGPCGCDADLDGSGVVDDLDATEVSNCVQTETCRSRSRADVNCDGELDDCDSQVVACQVAGGASCCDSVVCAGQLKFEVGLFAQ